MTAYANLNTKTAEATLQWEIRSVNHRYLELSFKLPDTLREVEYALRDIARGCLNRGKVDCFLRLDWNTEKTTELKIDHKLVDALIDASEQIRQQVPSQSLGVSPFDFLRWPSVACTPDKDITQLLEPIKESFLLALQNLMEVRAREGKKLGSFIQERLNKMSDTVNKIKNRLPEIKNNYRLKFQEKLRDLLLEIDKNRFEQELVYLMQKMDISEELDRLATHVIEVTRVLKSDKTLGRRLDFLMQELNRETNTIASKAIDNATIQDAVELKVLIEEMREQIQNLE